VRTVNMHEAKTNLSRLVAEVEQGEEIVIARAGVPVAKLVAYAEEPSRRRPGALRGKIWISDDFDAPMPEWEAAVDAPFVADPWPVDGR
jgi:prevent-host-death family protein